MKKVNFVSVNQCSHNRDYVEKSSKKQFFTLHLGTFLSDGSKTFRPVAYSITRRGIWFSLDSLFEGLPNDLYVSLSRSFFSCYNQFERYKIYKSDLSYFYYKLSPYLDISSDNFYPVVHACTKNMGVSYFFFATKVKED